LIFEIDLQADKAKPDGPARADACRFSFCQDGDKFIRIPVSYLLKLALADAIGDPQTDPLVQRTGELLMSHFLSDNTSPEVFSFFPSPLTAPDRVEYGAAAETAKRFLFCQLLAAYANQKFELAADGQKVEIYFSPQPPLRQKNAEQHHFRCILSRAVHEPLSFRLSPGRGQHHHQQSGRIARYIQCQPGHHYISAPARCRPCAP
jgi:hypothetical protein